MILPKLHELLPRQASLFPIVNSHERPLIYLGSELTYEERIIGDGISSFPTLIIASNNKSKKQEIKNVSKPLKRDTRRTFRESQVN